MDNLADRVIEANKEAGNNGVELDDIGFPLPRRRTPHSMCEYLTARLLYLNQYIYQYDGKLWLNDDMIEETRSTYYKLAKYPAKISDVQNMYVWRRCRDMVPTLDTSFLSVLPDRVFDMRTGDLFREKARTTSPWGSRSK